MSVSVPATVWRDTGGLNDYTNEGSNYIVDNLGTFLVDPSGTFITDTGVLVNTIPATIWEEDDSV